jgi:uncharacterized protein Usg
LWFEDKAFEFCAKQAAPRLEPYTLQSYVETYGSQQNFAVMCPATDYWQTKLSDIIQTLVFVHFFLYPLAENAMLTN